MTQRRNDLVTGVAIPEPIAAAREPERAALRLSFGCWTFGLWRLDPFYPSVTDARPTSAMRSIGSMNHSVPYPRNPPRRTFMKSVRPV